MSGDIQGVSEPRLYKPQPQLSIPSGAPPAVLARIVYALREFFSNLIWNSRAKSFDKCMHQWATSFELAKRELEVLRGAAIGDSVTLDTPQGEQELARLLRETPAEGEEKAKSHRHIAVLVDRVASLRPEALRRLIQRDESLEKALAGAADRCRDNHQYAHEAKLRAMGERLEAADVAVGNYYSKSDGTYSELKNLGAENQELRRAARDLLAQERRQIRTGAIHGEDLLQELLELSSMGGDPSCLADLKQVWIGEVVQTVREQCAWAASVLEPAVIGHPNEEVRVLASDRLQAYNAVKMEFNYLEENGAYYTVEELAEGWEKAQQRISELAQELGPQELQWHFILGTKPYLIALREHFKYHEGGGPVPEGISATAEALRLLVQCEQVPALERAAALDARLAAIESQLVERKDLLVDKDCRDIDTSISLVQQGRAQLKEMNDQFVGAVASFAHRSEIDLTIRAYRDLGLRRRAFEAEMRPLEKQADSATTQFLGVYRRHELDVLNHQLRELLAPAHSLAAEMGALKGLEYSRVAMKAEYVLAMADLSNIARKYQIPTQELPRNQERLPGLAARIAEAQQPVKVRMAALRERLDSLLVNGELHITRSRLRQHCIALGEELGVVDRNITDPELWLMAIARRFEYEGASPDLFKLQHIVIAYRDLSALLEAA